jgi:cyclophilin family peptidyl-prolyl cis-trans isomerase
VATDKRARKKEHRDQLAAERQAALRKRRLARFGGIALVLAAVIGWALLSGRDEGEPTAEETPRPAAAACDAEPPPPADPQQYDAAEQVIEEGVDYAAVISTSCGDITMDLLEDRAPETVNSFVFLAREGFYDGLTFHRIVSNFVIQGGDPEGTGGGGPGYVVKDEFPEKGNEYVFGTVAMANAGANSTGSQFFIVVHLGADDQTDEPAGLDPLYSLFGQVDPDSYDVIREISQQEVNAGSDPTNAERPIVPVYIESIEIIER